MTDYSYLSFLVILAVIIGAFLIHWRSSSGTGRTKQEKYRDFIMANPEAIGVRVKLEKNKSGLPDLVSAKPGRVGVIVRVDGVTPPDVTAILKDRDRPRKAPRKNMRLYIVSPRISEEMRALMDVEKLDWKEIPYDG